MQHDVYITSAPKDKKIASKVCSALEAKGMSCWTASRDMIPGINRAESVAEAIVNSRLMIIVLSKIANKDEELSNELILADKENIRIIPFRIDDMKPEKSMQFYLSGAHWMSATNPPTTEQLNQLAETIMSFIEIDIKREEEDATVKDQKNKINRKRKKWNNIFYVFLLVLLVVLVGVALVIEMPDRFDFLFIEYWGSDKFDAVDLTGVRGSSAGNINNLGLAVLQEDWIYYSYVDEGYHLYKESLESGERIRINEDQSYCLNVAADWIFYVNGDDHDSIYKIKTDGTERTKLNDHTSEFVHVVGEWIYFTDRSESDYGRIYRMRTDGSNLSIIINESVGFLNFASNSIYYVNWNERASLYRFDAINWEQEKINSNEHADFLIIDEEWIYFIDHALGAQICRIPRSGGAPERLIDESCDYLNLSGEWLYFLSYNRGGKMVRMRTDGSDQRTLNEAYSAYINIAGDWIYYLNRDQGNKLYRMTTDGGNDGPVGGLN